MDKGARPVDKITTKKRKAWNKGLTKDSHKGIASVSKKKALWWASDKREETRKKIGDSSRGRPGAKREKSSCWKGGRYVDGRDGYIMVYVGNYKYRPEHRVVMEQKLGRELTLNEEVHHINGKKDDNRIENLKIVVKEMHFCKVSCPYCGETFEVK